MYYTSLINVIVKSHIIYPSQFGIHSYCCFHLSLESHPLIREERTKQEYVKLWWLVLNSWGLDITHDKTTYSIWSIMWRLIDIRKTEENATVPARSDYVVTTWATLNTVQKWSHVRRMLSNCDETSSVTRNGKHASLCYRIRGLSSYIILPCKDLEFKILYPRIRGNGTMLETAWEKKGTNRGLVEAG